MCHMNIIFDEAWTETMFEDWNYIEFFFIIIFFNGSSKFKYVDYFRWLHGSFELCSLSSVEKLLTFEDVVQSLFTHVSLWCLFFDPCLTTRQSNKGVQLRKVNE